MRDFYLDMALETMKYKVTYKKPMRSSSADKIKRISRRIPNVSGEVRLPGQLGPGEDPLDLAVRDNQLLPRKEKKTISG